MFKYVFRPYDPIYLELFNKEKDRLKKFLGEDALIEHIGSTSVPLLGGKGIIDIAVVGDKENLSDISSKLIKAGYYFSAKDSTKKRLFHGKVVADDRRYHLHLTFRESKDFKEMISFRDYLKTHPKEFKEYERIKKYASKISKQDAKIYMKTKEPVILEILKKSSIK